MLIFQQNKFHKSKLSKEATERLLGQGLLISEGDFWRRQRRLAQPAFHRHRINEYASTILECAQAQAQKWQDEQATLNTLELKNQTALGNLQVTETGNEISLATVNLLQSLQQIAMANLNSQNVNAANSVSEQALSQMTAQAIVGAPPQVLQLVPALPPPQ